MKSETREKIAELIRGHMEENGITFIDECPFPVSWRTIWAIRDTKEKRTFSTKTQKLLCEFFKLDYEQDGHDLVITLLSKGDN